MASKRSATSKAIQWLHSHPEKVQQILNHKKDTIVQENMMMDPLNANSHSMKSTDNTSSYNDIPLVNSIRLGQTHPLLNTHIKFDDEDEIEDENNDNDNKINNKMNEKGKEKDKEKEKEKENYSTTKNNPKVETTNEIDTEKEEGETDEDSSSESSNKGKEKKKEKMMMMMMMMMMKKKMKKRIIIIKYIIKMK
ncbi:hypothetical protein LY90DRAFT_55647 [Neocallimastix californiae]|uniref:Uncharacterized protein n=1 Tax=Neocallimastix californiae TaxID=1754190 RepID=A0A1Y2BR69_9FUNG|nr:hypothetical protein LY90DRAFT_55647 [Neocallimastix californiae]|eukprot:ORY37127.1 hypothetical protein LY90DRAFT_55647 [Neocallimastix californiae]